MKQSNQIDFLTFLEHYNSVDEQERINASNYIEKFRKENLFLFLENLLRVISEPETSEFSKKIAIILSYRTFELIKSPNPSITTFQYIEKNVPGLINSFLSHSVSQFASFPLLSGHLFSSVFIIISEHNEENDIIQSLCENMKQVTDLNFIEGFLVSIEDITYDFELISTQYQSILNIIFSYLSISNIPTSIKIHSMRIINNLIYIIDDFFEDEEKFKLLLNIIEHSISFGPTKPISYECLSQLIIHRFPYFNIISEKYLLMALNDLNESISTNNENLIFSICEMIQNLPVKPTEEFYEQRSQIISTIFPSFFYSLLMILYKLPSINQNAVEDLNIGNTALETIFAIGMAVPEVSFPILSEFIENNIFKLDNSPVVRETSCTFLSIIVSNFGIPQIQNILFHLFAQISNNLKAESFSQVVSQIASNLLSDSSLGMKDASLKFLQSVISNRDLKNLIDNNFIIFFIPQMIEIMNNDFFAPVHFQAGLSLNLFLEFYFDSYGFSGLDLLSVLFALIDHSVHTNDHFVMILFDSINMIIRNLDFPQLEMAIPVLLKLVLKSFEDPKLNRNIDEILYMFTNVCKSWRQKSIQSEVDSSQIFLPVLDQLFNIFLIAFNGTQNDKLLFSISYLASVTKNCFDGYLPVFVDLVINYASGYLYTHENQRIDDFVQVFLFISEFFDLRPYLITLADLSLRLLEESASGQLDDLKSFSRLIKLFAMFVQKYFNDIGEKIEPLLCILSSVISKSEFFGDVDLKLPFFIEASALLTYLFEKIDLEGGAKLLDISYCLTRNIFSFIGKDDVDSGPHLIQFFTHVAKINPEAFKNFFLSEENALRFFYYLLQTEEYKEKANHFLLTIGINFEELIKQAFDSND